MATPFCVFSLSSVVARRASVPLSEGAHCLPDSFAGSSHKQSPLLKGHVGRSLVGLVYTFLPADGAHYYKAL